MKKKLFFYITFMLLFGSCCYSQNRINDSLKTVIRNSKADTTKVKNLNSLAYRLRKSKSDTSILLSNEALLLSRKLNWPHGEIISENYLGVFNRLRSNYDEAIIHYEKSIICCDKLISTKLKNQTSFANFWKGRNYSNIGIIYFFKNEFYKALDYCEKSIEITDKSKDLELYNSTLNTEGNIYIRLTKYSKALDCFYKALNIAESTKNKHAISNCYNNIGVIYQEMGNYNKALEYFLKDLAISKDFGDKMGLSSTYANIGGVHKYNYDFDKALDYFFEAQKLAESAGDKEGAAKILGNIGSVYYDQNKYDKANEYFEKSIKLKEEVGAKLGVASTLGNLGQLNMEIGNYDVAEKQLLNALKISEDLNAESNQKDIYLYLYALYEKMGRFDLALKKYKKYVDLKDSVLSKDNSQKLMESALNYDYEKKKALDEAETRLRLDKQKAMAGLEIEKGKILLENSRREKTILEKENELKELNLAKNETELKQKETEARAQRESIKSLNNAKLLNQAEIKSKQNTQYVLYGGLTIVLVFTGFMFNRFKVTQKQKHLIEAKERETQLQKNLIEEKHKEITDSINYAERIQRSFLASNELLDENLKEHFVFFQPKDVVSGDFYWATKVSNNFILVTADSTGHGVPGAIMSLLNITSLEAAIKDGYTQPADVLNATRKTIIDRLKKDGSSEGGKDGMDASLISFDFANNKFTYAAANNPVWLVRNNELIELIPDKMPVGKHDKDHSPFTQHEFVLQKNDVIYQLTDGMPDQFGGPKGKKFMYKKLKELLVSISHYPMEQQKEFLEKTLNSWKGNLEQVDDVTVIGVRV